MMVSLNKKSLRNSRNLIEALLLIRNTYFKKISTDNLLLTIDPPDLKEIEKNSLFTKQNYPPPIDGAKGKLDGIRILSKYNLQFKGFPSSREGLVVFLNNGVKLGKLSKLGIIRKSFSKKSLEVAFNPSKRKSSFSVYLGEL